MRRILLVEPGYRNKYPPLGLMKISAYHKRRGDVVTFVKGCDTRAAPQAWDRIYVSTLFTFYWDVTLKTIRFYLSSVPRASDLWVGGVTATLMGEEIRAATGATVVKGLVDRPGQLDPGSKVIVDELVPDYSLLGQVDYGYGLTDAYVGYATRGCPNRCNFCAVSRIEPVFVDYLPLRRQVTALESLYGPRPNLVLLDNSVLASARLKEIVRDILDLGFSRGSRLGKRLRRIDFNQGIDARLLTSENMTLLASIALDPLRLAFDDIRLRETYEGSIRLAVDAGIRNLSTYVLFNYLDTPEDFYERLKTNVTLNEKLGTHIYSFPMKFVPLDARDRSHVGPHWNRRLLRGVQCILVATRGMVGSHRDFFEAAFGESAREFVEIASMPEDYIVHRRLHASNGAADWRRDYQALSGAEIEEFLSFTTGGRVSEDAAISASTSRLKRLLTHYVEVEGARRDARQLTLETEVDRFRQA